MFNFKNFITEAKVSRNNLDKVADIFKRIVEKQLQTKLYRFAGPRGYSEIQDGVGILYFYDQRKAMRINYIRGEIVSLTLWKSFKIGKKGDLTVDLGGMGLLQSGKELISILKTPKVDKVATYGDLEEGFLTEMRRATPAEFAQIVADNLPQSISLSGVPWGVLADISLSNDVNIPVMVRNETKVAGTKGKNARFDLAKLLTGEVNGNADKAGKSEMIYYMKITAQDKLTKKFHSVKGDKKAEEMLRKAGQAINNPTQEQVKTEMMHPDTLFGIMRNLTQVVCRGTRNALIVYGGPGVGKTFVVEQAIKGEGLVKNKDWFVVKGKITTSSLYQTLFMHRKGGLLVFDDTDSVWNDSDAANILKAALDSYDERNISWLTNRTTNVSKMTDEDKEALNDKIDLEMSDDPESSKVKLPSEFRYEGRIVFISNLPYEKFDSAVLTRSAKIDMTLTDDQMFIRMESILPYLGDNSVDIDVKKEILSFLRQQNIKGLLTSPSMRTYVAAEDLYRSGLSNWKELLDYI